MNFTFTEQQISYILQALAARPYNEVAALIPEIQKQAQAQLSPTSLQTLEASPATE